MRHCAITLKKLQALRTKLPTQLRGCIEGEAPLLLPGCPQKRGKLARLVQRPSRGPRNAESLNLTTHILQEILPEMRLRIRPQVKHFRLSLAPRDKFCLPTRPLHPLLHRFLITNNTDARLEFIKRHAREPFSMEPGHLILISVMVGWPQQHSADATLRHKGVVSLGRVDLGAADFEELIKVRL